MPGSQATCTVLTRCAQTVQVLTELIRKAEQAVNRLANKLGAQGAAPTLSSSPQKTSVEQLLNATRSSVEEMAAAGSGSVLGTLDAEPVSSSEGLDDEESDCEVCDRSFDLRCTDAYA